MALRGLVNNITIMQEIKELFTTSITANISFLEVIIYVMGGRLSCPLILFSGRATTGLKKISIQIRANLPIRQQND